MRLALRGCIQLSFGFRLKEYKAGNKHASWMKLGIEINSAKAKRIYLDVQIF